MAEQALGQATRLRMGTLKWLQVPPADTTAERDGKTDVPQQ